MTDEEAFELALLKMPERDWKRLETRASFARMTETGRTGIAAVDAFFDRIEKKRRAPPPR